MFAPAELTEADIYILFPSECRQIKVLEDKNEELQEQLRRANLELEKYKSNIKDCTSQDINRQSEYLLMFIRTF